MKAPTDEKVIQVSGKENFGNIYYTKNLNLDDEGFIKQSSRVVSIQNEIDTSNLGLAVAFGRNSVYTTSTSFVMVQNRTKAYSISISESSITFNVHIGTGVATLTADSHGGWYKNKWHITDDNDLFSLDDTTDVATYTEITDGTPANLTSGKIHYVEGFKNKNAICVSDGNTINLYTESAGTYSLDVTLTLQADMEVVAMKYSNYQMGIITQLSDTAQGQNQDALFFTWDGASSTPSQGITTGSDKVIGIVAYQGSWVILTRDGQLKFFNGGGWTKLPKSSALEFYFKKLIWGSPYTRDILGDCMIVEGDLIYINIDAIFNNYGLNYEKVLPSLAGGILVYDPDIGIYNRYSPSISPVNMLRVESSGVNTTTDVLTITSGTIPSTGSEVKYVSSKTSQIGGLRCPKVYYCIKHNSTEFSLAESEDDATNGVKVDLTSTGASNNYFMALEAYDYGQFYATKAGAIALMGETKPVHDHLIFGSELQNHSSTGESYHVNLTVPDFRTVSYFVMSRDYSLGVLDTQQKVYIKFKPLKETDYIDVKSKIKDVLGLPVTTPQTTTATNNQCTWTSSTVFTTTANLEDAKTAFDNGVKLECEILSGAGAGDMSQISNITYNTGTYTVTLEDAIKGASSGRYCDVKIDNWDDLGRITYLNNSDGYVSFPIGGNSKWVDAKVILKGSDITIEQSTIVNDIIKENS